MNKLMWVLVALLAGGGCKNKGADSTGAAMAKMSELKDEMCRCKDAKCAQDVSDKATKWTQEQAKDGKPPAMSEADSKRAMTIGEEMGKCMQTAMSAAPPAAPQAGSSDAPQVANGSDADRVNMTGNPNGDEPAGAVGPDGLPVECGEYKAQAEKLKSCDKLPEKVKDALIKAYTDAAGGWVNLPEGAKTTLKTSCKNATEAIVNAAKGPCGW